ncbi:ChrR family anti-sigma-E factor [Coralliovum pocilloporae]|uniref:ChrR family anti-sigma-E factor n=1 Tax=Coralliovum pocilloporae TaxID=3066369 RepID=UPI003307C49A
MMINHHISDEMLVSYAAGALSDAARLFVASHVQLCERCEDRVAKATLVGGHLLETASETPLSDNSFDHLEALLDKADAEPEEQTGDMTPSADLSHIPAPLQLLLGQDYDALQWKTVAPGVKQYQLPIACEDGEKARLLKLSPGFVTPMHSHHGHEMTLVLKGSFSDESGRYKVGDVQEADGEVDHQPIADTEEDCICFIVTDAPLQFRGIVGKVLQPILGF